MSKNLNPIAGSASATGNPRNKTALKPGFSLIGWVRLGNSGEDLTGLKGKTIPVSHHELAKHNKPDDMWMAVRGKVYNVTRYLDYHPGGVEQLMRGAGKDATSLFDEYHAWVNIDQLLAKCYVGPLKNTVILNLKDSLSSIDIRSSKLSPPSATSAMKFPLLLSASSETLNITKTIQKQQSVEIIPRFDWIQKTSELSIYFYTKSLCNCGILIENICDKESEIKIIIANTTNSYRFSFLKSVKWPCAVKINHETGKIEITFEKQIPELWSNFGIFERTRSKDETIYTSYEIAERKFFNHDSFEMTLRPEKKQILIVPIGFHLNFKLTVMGKDVIRSYTPIPFTFSTTKEITKMPSDILFLIKTYNIGTLSKYLSQECSNELLNVSQPKGSFDLNFVKNHTKFAMIAAGSGITPMVSVLDYLLERINNKIESINFYYFNKTEADIWLCEDLNRIMERDQRLVVKHILSEPNKSWTGETGRITKEIVQKIVQLSTFVFVCGPTTFNDVSVQLLSEHQSIAAHCFQG